MQNLTISRVFALFLRFRLFSLYVTLIIMMLYRVTARLGFVDGSTQEISFDVRAKDEDSLNAIVTRDYIMESVSDD
jgi:hypothetical protein